MIIFWEKLVQLPDFKQTLGLMLWLHSDGYILMVSIQCVSWKWKMYQSVNTAIFIFKLSTLFSF
jgi:hypothetical protein